MNPFSLNSRATLVTGSSQGIGLAIGRAIHDAGASVVFHGKTDPAPDLPEGADWTTGDLLEPDGPARLVRTAFAAQPQLDLLVCNAGSFFDTPFLEMDNERWDRTMNLNVRVNYFLAQAFARELVARQRPGAIVTTCSTNGFQSEDDSPPTTPQRGPWS
jgi:NAD(P)-dependent dehydrogenase (short-subunit alcohol dehydrogenase family)